MKLLEVRSLRFAAEGREILHGVDLDVGAGETVVIVGKNGAGKSSLAGAVMGTVGAKSEGVASAGAGSEAAEGSGRASGVTGEIIFNGEEIAELKLDERAQRGMFLSWQAPVEVPGIDMMEMIRTALEERAGKALRRREIEAQMAEIVKDLKMDAFTAGREVNVGASGGERKKNEILQMMMLEPKLAILDEIDSGLDVEAARQVSEILARYQKSTGVAYIIITHNLRVLEKLKIDKVVEMADGRVARVGGEEILTEIKEGGFSK